MTALVKESVQYFGGMDIEGYARSVAEDATELAIAALRRRRPDLSGSAKRPAVPAEEAAQFELDKLAFFATLTERLMAEMNGLVYGARQHGASWARVGTALKESPQTAFNRYRSLEEAGSAEASRSRKTGGRRS